MTHTLLTFFFFVHHIISTLLQNFEPVLTVVLQGYKFCKKIFYYWKPVIKIIIQQDSDITLKINPLTDKEAKEIIRKIPGKTA